jgi:hypothetical protein
MALSSMKKDDKPIHPQVQEKIDYINSPIYKRRLIELGQPKETVDKLIKDRINFLKKTKIEYNSPNLSDSQLALAENVKDAPRISMRKPDNPKYLSGSGLAHEIGHLTSGLGPANVEFGNSFEYEPIKNESGYGYNIPESRKKFNNLISSGTTVSMSPKEKLFFDLQNKNLNELPTKGYGIYKQTGGKSLNDYFYNDKFYSDAFPAGTHVDLNEQTKSTSLPNFNNDDLIQVPTPYRSPKEILNIINNKAYSDEYLSKPHNVHLYQQGIPMRRMNTTGDPFQPGYISHTYSALENKADLDAVRHLLKKYNYTQNFGDDITPELWQRAINDKRLNQDDQFKRMRENFDDKAIINLNNKVAYENNLPNVRMQSMNNNIQS